MRADRSEYYRRAVEPALPWRQVGRGKNGKIRCIRPEHLESFREAGEAEGLSWEDLDTLYRHARAWADSEDDHDRRKALEALRGLEPCPRCSPGPGQRGSGKAALGTVCALCLGEGMMLCEGYQGWLYVAWHERRGWPVAAPERPHESARVPTAVTIGACLDEIRSQRRIVEAARMDGERRPVDRARMAAGEREEEGGGA